VYEKRKKKKRKTCIIEELLIESLSRKVAAWTQAGGHRKGVDVWASSVPFGGENNAIWSAVKLRRIMHSSCFSPWHKQKKRDSFHHISLTSLKFFFSISLNVYLDLLVDRIGSSLLVAGSASLPEAILERARPIVLLEAAFWACCFGSIVLLQLNLAIGQPVGPAYPVEWGGGG
jgi:hypothetical protein